MASNVAMAIIAAAGVAVALPSPRSSISYVSPALPHNAKVTREDLRRYAEALVEIRRVRLSLNQALVQAPAKIEPQLRRQADSLIAQILLRHRLPLERFNEISRKVDTNAAVRRNVRQIIMEEQLGV